MDRSLKKTSSWPKIILNAALHPNRFLSGVRYRIKGWKVQPASALPTSAAEALVPGNHANFKQLSFTFSAIALSAKVACADGALTSEKYVAFRDSFPLSSDVCNKIRSLFILACRNETPAWHYVGQIKHLFPKRPDLFITLLERLFRIATADGELSQAAEHTLASIAHQFGISATDYGDMYNYYAHVSGVTTKQQAQYVMGTSPRAEPEVLKKRYHVLMQRYHPDRFAGQKISQEMQMLLQIKSSEITMAYRALAKQAG